MCHPRQVRVRHAVPRAGQLNVPEPVISLVAPDVFPEGRVAFPEGRVAFQVVRVGFRVVLDGSLVVRAGFPVVRVALWVVRSCSRSYLLLFLLYR